MRRAGGALLLAFLFMGDAYASPENSPRPDPRSGDEALARQIARQVADAPVRVAVAAVARPDPRSDPEASAALADPLPAGAAVLSPRPDSRPENLKRKATVRSAGFMPAAPARNVFGGRRKVCAANGITAERIAAIPARVSGCGLEGGVRVTAVQGIPLSQPATIDCQTAEALNNWVAKVVVPTVGRRGGGVTQLRVAAHYACRPRNNQRGAKISEHGRGRAIDISGFALKNGTQINVLTGWNDRRQGPLLKTMHEGACGIFGTVLGPKSDRFHRDHFHLDTARYRSGAYCR